MRPFLFISYVLLMLLGCKDKEHSEAQKPPSLDQIVVISINAPDTYLHYLEQDSIGKPIDSTGTRMYFSKRGFFYVDDAHLVQNWIPEPQIKDTLVIPYHGDYLELMTPNFYTSIKQTFLVQKGDTVVFNYEQTIPKASIQNRKVEDIALNYNNYRHKALFNNKYTSHYMVLGNGLLDASLEKEEQNSIFHYTKAQQDYTREIHFLDSLAKQQLISKVDYRYRKDALDMLMEKHAQFKPIKNWLAQKNALLNNEVLEKNISFNLSKTDSLLKFSFFRDYLLQVSKYNLDTIKENNGNAGSVYIDSRIRFDSISEDNRFNQTAKNFLLLDAYNGIGENFKVKDKVAYFKKLQENTSNLIALKELQEKYKLDFENTDKLLLTSMENDSLTYSTLIENNKGKWLYLDFWASWCGPCKKTMPAAKKLHTELENENVTFIYLSLHDKKDKWKSAIASFQIEDQQQYFIENSNLSKVIEELGVKYIPHYLIYNPKGELVHGNANRPGKGAKEQLLAFINTP